MSSRRWLRKMWMVGCPRPETARGAATARDTQHPIGPVAHHPIHSWFVCKSAMREFRKSEATNGKTTAKPGVGYYNTPTASRHLRQAPHCYGQTPSQLVCTVHHCPPIVQCLGCFDPGTVHVSYSERDTLRPATAKCNMVQRIRLWSFLFAEPIGVPPGTS